MQKGFVIFIHILAFWCNLGQRISLTAPDAIFVGFVSFSGFLYLFWILFKSRGELPFQTENSGFYVVLNNQFCSHCIYSIFSACLLKKWILLEDEIVIPLWMFERKVHFWLNFELLNELKLSYNILHFLLLFMVVFRPSESILKLWDFHLLWYLELLWQYGWLMYFLIQFALLTIALSL